MKVLHINQSDIAGGAAIAGYRLHQGLLNQGIDSRLLVGTVKTSSDRVAPTPRKRRIENQLYRFAWRFGLNYLNLIGSFDIPKHIFYQEASILNFHNLHNGYFNYLAIPSLAESKPAVFTLHDMWSFTGHCAYSYDCDRWKNGCGQCPNLTTYPAVPRDNTHIEWKLKNWVYSRADLTVVAPSRWLATQAQQSMLSRFPIHHIPYGLDTSAYQPLDTNQCRSVLGIPDNKKVLMCGAESLNDWRKGGDLLIAALTALPDSLRAEAILMILGEGGEAIAREVNMPILPLGYVGGDRLKAAAYSAADLFLLPTRADNLPLVLQESMACGTPMISFKIGGVPDLVQPGITGYLAAPEDTQDFARGIQELLEDATLRGQMSQNCRAITLKEHPLDLQTQRYIDLYRQILNR